LSGDINIALYPHLLLSRSIDHMTITFFRLSLLPTMATKVSGAASRAQRKLALVIGIAEYECSDQMQNLPNTVNDANDMSLALASIGFIVTRKLNLKRCEMKNTLYDF
jgi:hypothetical protein